VEHPSQKPHNVTPISKTPDHTEPGAWITYRIISTKEATKVRKKRVLSQGLVWLLLLVVVAAGNSSGGGLGVLESDLAAVLRLPFDLGRQLRHHFFLGGGGDGLLRPKGSGVGMSGEDGVLLPPSCGLLAVVIIMADGGLLVGSTWYIGASALRAERRLSEEAGDTSRRRRREVRVGGLTGASASLVFFVTEKIVIGD
jgi:hypothetical protein